VRTRLGATTSIAQGFFIGECALDQILRAEHLPARPKEFFMTSQLILAVFLLAGEKHKGTVSEACP
jgi:hypothetical protein